MGIFENTATKWVFKETEMGSLSISPPGVLPVGAASLNLVGLAAAFPKSHSLSHTSKSRAHLLPIHHLWKKNLRWNHWHGQHVMSNYPQFSAFFWMSRARMLLQAFRLPWGEALAQLIFWGAEKEIWPPRIQLLSVPAGSESDCVQFSLSL